MPKQPKAASNPLPANAVQEEAQQTNDRTPDADPPAEAAPAPAVVVEPTDSER